MAQPFVLKTEDFKPYVDTFNEHDEEIYVQHLPNAMAFDFLAGNAPLFDCPDEDFKRTFLFRWWTFRKHIKHTPDGFVITEVLPNVGWAGKHNTINCPAGHHFYEGRWLHDQQYLDDYAVFWFRKGGALRSYSFWAADALLARHRVRPNEGLLVDLLDDLIENYKGWENERLDPSGLFWQIDDRDGMEISIGGHGCRATINAYMYGDALAIAEIADMADRKDVAEAYRDKAATIKRLVQDLLWDDEAQFFKVKPRIQGKSCGILEWTISNDAELTMKAVPSASHCWHADTVAAMNDGALPKNSNDRRIPRMTFWNHQATTEWVQYAFPKAMEITSAEVYWFEDKAGCYAPASWRLLYRDGDAWKPVSDPSGYGTAIDQFNTVTFAPVTTTALRIEVTSKGAGQDDAPLADVRELHGYTPWYTNLPDPGYEGAWTQLTDPKGFHAPFGPTTAEQRHPRFRVDYKGSACQWNGPSWPFSTTITLTALANLLNNYDQELVSKADYFETLGIYTRSHSLQREDGTVVPWIDENLNPFTGDWIARTLKIGKEPRERGKDYNHSAYCDLVISGLVGLRPQLDDTLVVNPLLPDGTWDHFCLDNVVYHGHVVAILWDKDGTRYGKGRGLRVYADGELVAQSDTLTKVTGRLPDGAGEK